MGDESDEIVIQREQEKEIKFTRPFKWVLAFSLLLTGIFSAIGIWYVIQGAVSGIWTRDTVNGFIYNFLFTMSILLCFIALVGILVTKRPFSGFLVGCTRAFGVLFILASAVVTHIDGYRFGVHLMRFGNFTLFDGILFTIGLLGIIFAYILHYGFRYQENSDMTV